MYYIHYTMRLIAGVHIPSPQLRQIKVLNRKTETCQYIKILKMLTPIVSVPKRQMQQCKRSSTSPEPGLKNGPPNKAAICPALPKSPPSLTYHGEPGKQPSPHCDCGEYQTIKHITEVSPIRSYNGRTEDFLLATDGSTDYINRLDICL